MHVNLLDVLREDVGIYEAAKRIALDRECVQASSVHASNIYKNMSSEEGMHAFIKVAEGRLSCEEIFFESGKEKFFLAGTFVRSRFVFLRFISAAGFEVYLVQFLNGLVGCFSFSDSSAYIFKRGGKNHQRWVFSLLELAYSDVEKFKHYLSSPKKFYGLIINTEVRPSHFFYEMLCPVVNHSTRRIVFSARRHIYWNNTDFVDTAKLVGASSVPIVVDWKDFSEKCILNKWVVFQPGFGVWGQYNKKCYFVDDLLRRMASDLPHSDETHRPILWLSILSEEKSWVEQNDVYSKIIDSFLELGHEPIVIFDGLTRTCSESYLPYSKKRKGVEYIQKEVGKYFEFVDIHGFTAEEKISFAMLSDIFIASVGTDSMYPSRIADKPGIVHSSPDVSMFGKHVYSQGTVKTDPAFSCYLDGQDDLRPDKKSYSIKEGVVESLFWSCCGVCQHSCHIK